MPKNKKTRVCPQCGLEKAITTFECLPLDERCSHCIPADTARELYDKRVQQAGQKLAQILDANEASKGLKPLERMVSQAYDSWGGPAAFMEDGVTWIKDLAANPRTKAAAVQAWHKLLTLHAKVDRMKLEDDWKQMDDETLRANLQLKLMALLAETETDKAKKDTIDKLTGPLDDDDNACGPVVKK